MGLGIPNLKPPGPNQSRLPGQVIDEMAQEMSSEDFRKLREGILSAYSSPAILLGNDSHDSARSETETWLRANPFTPEDVTRLQEGMAREALESQQNHQAHQHWTFLPNRHRLSPQTYRRSTPGSVIKSNSLTGS